MPVFEIGGCRFESYRARQLRKEIIMWREKERIDTVTIDHVPESARAAIEYCVWTCCQDAELNSGPTPLYWQLMSVLASHIHSAVSQDETQND